MAFTGICVVEAKKNFFFWLIEGVACAQVEVKVQVRLTYQLASNNFVGLKRTNLFLQLCLQYYLALIRSTKVPKLVIQSCPTTRINSGSIAVFKSHVLVDVTWKKNQYSVLRKFLIFTVEINNEWFVIRIDITQNKNRVPSWWYRCSRNGCCCDFWSRCWFKTIETAAWTSGRTIFLNFPILNF